MITIKELKSKKEMSAFVLFPFTLYKKNKNWVPPIIKEELASFDKDKNPVFKNASAQFFLAYKNGAIVGRIAAIINQAEVEEQQVKKMRFGWFDFIDDLDVSKALLDKVYEIGKANKLAYIEGPLGFSSMDKVGVLTKGYEHLGNMVTWYNAPYYVAHYKAHKYSVEKEYIESIIDLNNVDITKYRRYATLIKERFGLKEVNFSDTKSIMPYVDEMFELYHKTYSRLSSFVPISKEQIAYFKEKYIPFINPEYIKFVIDKEGKLVSFAILMPYFAKGLQKAKGKLFPFGFYHLLKAKKKNDTVVSYLIGIAEEYQNKGVTAIVFDEFYKTTMQNNIKYLILTPQLKDNNEIHKIWRHFNPDNYKERSTFRLAIS